MAEDQVIPQAIVREGPDGQLVLEDPMALAVVRGIAKHNCRITFKESAERVKYFVERAAIRKLGGDDVVIVVVNADDVHGAYLAAEFMPGMNWQPFRERGETPFARGLAGRDGLDKVIATFDPEAAEKLRTWTDGIAVLVVDHGIAEVFKAEST